MLWPDAAAAAADVTVDAPPSLAGAARRIEQVDFPALGAALERAGLSLPSRVHVTLLPNDDPAARSVPLWIVGFAAGSHDVVLFPERVVSYPYDSLESIVRHEITHLALTARAGGGALPRWFHEGVATSVDAGWRVPAQVRLLAAMLDGPDTTDLARLFSANAESETREAYLLSAVLVDDLRRRHGADAPGAIAARVADGILFARAFQLETGVTTDAAAARAWRGYRRWTAWLPAITSASATWALILAIAFAAYVAQRRRRIRRRRQWDEEDTRY
jgi:hypothetical protein